MQTLWLANTFKYQLKLRFILVASFLQIASYTCLKGN